MKQVVTVGIAVLAGAAVIEAALIPGLLIGGAAVLVPRYLPKLLPGLVRRKKSRPASSVRRSGTGQALVKAPGAVLPKFAVGQAIAKTVTYRIIVTTLDFTTNYIVIGELATAAGPSTFNLVAGPLFYFAHEAVWNYLGHPQSNIDGAAVDARGRKRAAGQLCGVHRQPRTGQDHHLSYPCDCHGFRDQLCRGRQCRAGGRTLVHGFRRLGPFVYYGHEKAWEYFGERGGNAAAEPNLLPAPV